MKDKSIQQRKYYKETEVKCTIKSMKRGTNCTKVNCDQNSFVEGGKISISPITFKGKN